MLRISPYLNINRIEFIITYKCTGNCRHCSVGDKLNSNDGCGSVEKNAAAKAVRELSKLFQISSVMTFGGEPLIYPDVVCEIHKTAAECGINTRQLITNGCFTADKKHMQNTAQSLFDAGVNDLLLSADIFHQQTLPLKHMISFAECAKKSKIPGIRIQPAWVRDKNDDNFYNRETKKILTELSELGITSSDGNNIFMAGRAAENLSEFYQIPHIDLSAKCGSMPYTEPLTDVTSVTIEPNGNMTVCGFVIGNIYTDSIERIVEGYDPNKNVYMSALIKGGGEALLEAAKRNGIEMDISKCYSVCDICRKITDLTK